MKIIEITEHKMSDLYECAEKVLKYGGKVMNYLEDMKEHSSMGHRGYGNRHDSDGYGEREWEEEDEDSGYGNRMGERRGVRGTGRYSRYR
jgi:hypothetical protein